MHLYALKSFAKHAKVCSFQPNMQMYAKNILFHIIKKKKKQFLTLVCTFFDLFINEQWRHKLHYFIGKQ